MNPTPPNTGDAELDLNDKLTYEIYHLVGAVANECHAAGLFTSEDEAGMAVLPDFDQAVKEIMQLIAAHDRALVKTILAEDVPERWPDDAKKGSILWYQNLGHNKAIDQITTALQKRLEGVK